MKQVNSQDIDSFQRQKADETIQRYKTDQLISQAKIDEIFYPLRRKIELAVKGDITILVIEGSSGHGKTTAVNYTFKSLNKEFAVITGKVTDAKLYELLYTYNEQKKAIVFRDVSRILSSLNSLDMLKAFSDKNSGRAVNCHSFGVSMRDLPDSFIAGVPLIFETNKIKETTALREHLEALDSRGEFFYWALSHKDLLFVMKSNAIEMWHKECTDYLISKRTNISKRLLNLRTQSKAFVIYQAAVRDGKEWKSEIDLYLKDNMTEGEKLLHEFAGQDSAKKSDFCKFVARRTGLTLRRAQQKVKDWIELSDFVKEGSCIRLNEV